MPTHFRTLLVDNANRPLGWVRPDEIPAAGTLSGDMAVAASPLFDRRATLKDALSLLLDADAQAGIAVDRRRSVLGLVTADMTAERMRDGAHVVADEPYPLGNPER